MGAPGVDERQLDLAALDALAEPAGQEVGGEGASDTAAQDEDRASCELPGLLDEDLVVAVGGSSETSLWPAFSIHFGMSILEPLSEDRTARTSPTWDSRMPRMSSIRGPGQKLPRASIVRVMAGRVSRIGGHGVDAP